MMMDSAPRQYSTYFGSGAKLIFKDIDGRSISEVDDFDLSFYRFSD